MDGGIDFVRMLILTIINSGIVGVVISNMFAAREKKDKKKDDMALALQCLLRYKLQDLHHRFMNEGGITPDEFRDFEQAYQVYHALGGNGTVEKMYHEIEKLEFKEDDR